MSELDPLEEIGDLVGKTLNMLPSAGSDAYMNTQKGGYPGAQSSADEKPTQDKDRHDPLAAFQELDLLSASTASVSHVPGSLSPSASRPLDPTKDPLSSRHSLFQEESLGDAEPAQAQTGGSGGGQGRTPPSLGAPEILGSSGVSEMSVSRPLFPGAIAPLRVCIREPEKVEVEGVLGIKTHFVQYVVRTDSSVPGMIADGLEVKRRFSDFDALHKYLKMEYRGYFVPPLPEKPFLQGKMAQQDFIRLRRADLQAFIEGLVRHPVLRVSEALKLFLLQPGELARNPAWGYMLAPPTSHKQQHIVTASSGSLEDQLQAVKTGLNGWGAAVNALSMGVSWMKQSVSQLVTKHDLSEEEQLLRQQKELLGDLERLLELAVESARGLCGRQEAMCGDVRELGRTFAMLSRFEEAVQSKVGHYTAQGSSAAARSADLSKAAYGAARQAPVWKTMSIKTAASLVALHDYYTLVPDAVAVLTARENALTALHLLQDDLTSKAHALEIAQSAANRPRLPSAGASPSQADRRVLQIANSVSALEEQIKTAQTEYTLLKERNLSELARLNVEREVDFRRMLSNFAKTQAQLVAASADMWATLASEFEASPQSQPNINADAEQQH